MTLTLFLLLLLSVFLIPAILLPQNRIRFFSISSSSATLVLLALIFIGNFFGMERWEDAIGSFFYPMWSPLLKHVDEITLKEANHLSTWFTYLFFYFVVYLLIYFIMKQVFIGSNPNIHRPTKWFLRFLEVFLFLLTTYVPLSMFFISIRGIIPLRDGTLGQIFNLIYRLEA